MKRVAMSLKGPAAIASEWDALAHVRQRQIATGRDHSATVVLAPAILKLLPRVQHVVDIGCGTGWLTRLALKRANSATGVDASRESVSLAIRNSKNPRLAFVRAEFGRFAGEHPATFDAAMANMTLSTVADVPRLLRAVNSTLRPGGVFVFTVPHPCFWPSYWGYDAAKWFRYDKEIAIEARFRIGAERTEYTTTHFHRPLEQYVSQLRSAAFVLSEIRELYGKGFPLPRFIAAKCRTLSQGA